MMDCLPKLGLTGVGARLLLVTSLIGLAIAINVPRAQQPVGGSNNPTDWNAISAAQRSAVSHLLNEANLCLAADDLDCVHSNLDELNEFTDLSVLETVSVKQFQANVGYLIDEPILSIVAYEEIIALPTEDAFASLARTATRNLATLYFQNGRPDDAFAMYDRYMTLPGTSPSARDYYGLAAMLYQADRFADAIDPLKQAIALSEEPNKQYYSVLYVAQSETGDEAGMLDTIEKLNAYWPDESSAALAALSNPEAAPAYLRSIGQYLPMNSIQPMYPPDAIARGIEGSVLVQYTVGTDGSTKDVEVLESSSEIFEAAAIEAARQYEYRQRTIDGTPVEVAGVKTLIEFALPDGG